MVGREAADKEDSIGGYLEYPERKWGSAKARKGIAITLRAQT